MGEGGRTDRQGLVGAGGSRVGTQGAMRARDVARPSEQDLAEAERTVQVQHARPVEDASVHPHPQHPKRPRPADPGRRRQPGTRPEAS